MGTTSFAIRKDRLGDDSSWRQRRSDSSSYDIRDFDFEQGVPLAPRSATRDFWPNFWRPMVSGLVAWLAILLLLIATRDSTAAIAIGGNGLAIPFGPAAAAFIGLLYLLYVSVLFAQIPSDVTIQPAKFDKWRYVVPGWQPCYFTFGSEGVSVDGTHFLYFFEWDDLKEIIEHQNRLVLRNLNEHVLTIPRRFFEQTNGGDLSWNEMLEFVKKHKPRGSIWS